MLMYAKPNEKCKITKQEKEWWTRLTSLYERQARCYIRKNSFLLIFLPVLLLTCLAKVIDLPSILSSSAEQDFFTTLFGKTIQQKRSKTNVSLAEFVDLPSILVDSVKLVLLV